MLSDDLQATLQQARKHGLILDTNLLLLFVVGSLDRDLVGRHNRTRSYGPEGHDLLCKTLAAVPDSKLLTTPNILSETSNLITQHGLKSSKGKIRDFAFRLRGQLAAVTADWLENYLQSRQIYQRNEFTWLGLTDSGLLELATRDKSVIFTADSQLHRAALAQDLQALNFAHLLERAWATDPVGRSGS